MKLVLRGVRIAGLGAQDVAVEDGRVAAIAPPGRLPPEALEADLEGCELRPGLVNAHDHLDLSTFPALGRPPYASVYQWAADVDAGRDDPRVRAALAVPLADRLFLGGLRNLLAGATAVAHHNPFHRSLARPDFPVRVLQRYDFAHSPGLTPALRRSYRTSDRRIPWMVHAAEGTDARCAGEVGALAEANVLRQNTVIVHGIAIRPEDMPRIAAARACVVWCPEANRRLYGSTAPVAALREAGVRLGLGSDSPAAGVRDLLSTLAAARREGVLADDELLDLASRGSAEVARLPAGALEPGAAADLIAVPSAGDLLAGRRAALGLVLVAGRPLYGDPTPMMALQARAVRCRVDGREKLIAESVGRRAAALLAGRPPLDVAWIDGLDFRR